MKKKTEQINMSVTETELDFMRKSAKQLGVSLSEFIRAPCLDSHPLPPPEVNWKDYAEKIREVGRQIDALALQGNTKKWIDPDDYDNLFNKFNLLLSEIEKILIDYKEEN